MIPEFGWLKLRLGWLIKRPKTHKCSRHWTTPCSCSHNKILLWQLHPHLFWSLLQLKQKMIWSPPLPLTSMETNKKGEDLSMPARHTSASSQIIFQMNKWRSAGPWLSWTKDRPRNGLTESTAGNQPPQIMELTILLTGTTSASTSEPSFSLSTRKLWQPTSWKGSATSKTDRQLTTTSTTSDSSQTLGTQIRRP